MQHLNELIADIVGVSLVQFFVLQKVTQFPGVSATVLAEKIKIHRSTLTQTLKRMERCALLYVTPDPQDKRRHLIAATGDGLQKFRSAKFFFNSIPTEVLKNTNLDSSAAETTEALATLNEALLVYQSVRGAKSWEVHP